jgi:hypothetical protein
VFFAVFPAVIGLLSVSIASLSLCRPFAFSTMGRPTETHALLPCGLYLVSLIPAQTGITAYWLDNAGDYALILGCVNHF